MKPIKRILETSRQHLLPQEADRDRPLQKPYEAADTRSTRSMLTPELKVFDTLAFKTLLEFEFDEH